MSDGFALDVGALVSASLYFSDDSVTLAQAVDLARPGGVETGDGGLDGLISRLAQQIEVAVAGAGQALQADAGGLRQSADNYLRADFASGPLP
jgi:hypothetical protein